ncbi:TPA: dTDP-6-deoxy-L-hexose 3-O-methyltransferase [Escherichia coli]|nr:dTDP-6-deoxy-L-hexose 3-O-methyltransferase [Escherichia coli]
MTTITKERIELFIKNPLENGLARSEQMEVARIALASLEAEPVAYQYRQWDAEYDEWGEWEDCGECAFERFVEEEKCQGAGVQTRKLYTAPPVPVVPEEISMASKLPLMSDQLMLVGYVKGWNACRAAMLQSGNFREISETSTNSPITLTPLPGGFTIEDAKELHEDLVRSHISQALSGEKMKKKDRDADLLWIHGVIVQAAWFVKASLDALPEPLREEKGRSPTEESEAGL